MRRAQGRKRVFAPRLLGVVSTYPFSTRFVCFATGRGEPVLPLLSLSLSPREHANGPGASGCFGRQGSRRGGGNHPPRPLANPSHSHSTPSTAPWLVSSAHTRVAGRTERGGRSPLPLDGRGTPHRRDFAPHHLPPFSFTCSFPILLNPPSRRLQASASTVFRRSSFDEALAACLCVRSHGEGDFFIRRGLSITSTALRQPDPPGTRETREGARRGVGEVRVE